MNDVSGVLGRAADLLSEPGKWVQRELGFDAEGNRIRNAGEIKRAICFCAAGAIWRAAGVKYGEDDDAVVWRAFDQVTKAAHWKNGIGPWNDAPERTQAEVVAKLREAALLAQSPNITGGGE